jgi:hypothetical protein
MRSMRVLGLELRDQSEAHSRVEKNNCPYSAEQQIWLVPDRRFYIQDKPVRKISYMNGVDTYRIVRRHWNSRLS